MSANRTLRWGAVEAMGWCCAQAFRSIRIGRTHEATHRCSEASTPSECWPTWPSTTNG